MNKQFGAILSEGISSIAHRWHKTKSAVYREITQHLREAGFDLTDSTVEGWCRGFVPKEPQVIARIVRYCMQRGRIDRPWVESLLFHAHYPERTDLLNEVFPLQKDGQDAHIPSNIRTLQYVDDPAITLRTPLGRDLVGRQDLLATLKQRLIARANQGMMALIGLPGVGKTTLAMELAHSHEMREAFRDGILYVNLGPQPDIGHHLERWAKLLGLMTESARPSCRQEYMEAIHASIGKRRMLLVIEDAWTVDAALAFQIGGPYCAHLLTTRFSDIALRFADQGVVKVAELNEDESKLLLARFIPQIVKNEPEQLRSLIRAVDGLPLALTLIGKHLQVHAFHHQPRRLQHALLALQQATERLHLEYPQRPLEANGQNSPSLMASIGTSYEALSISAQRALRALCIFPVKPNTFSEEAALVVSASSSAILDELTDAGLLESTGAGRYTIHQTIADYALLKHRGPQAERRLVKFFVEYAQAHTKDYNLLEQEASNILYALSLAAAGKMTQCLVEGIQAFFHFLLLRGWYKTALSYCQQELEAAKLLDDQEGICIACTHLGTLHVECGAYNEAEVFAQEGLALARQLHASFHLSTFLHLQGNIAVKRGASALAEEYAQEGLAIAHCLNDRELLSLHLLVLGIAKNMQGEYSQGESLLQEGLKFARQDNEPRTISSLLTALGSFAGMRGKYTQAESYYQEGLTLARSTKNIERVAACLKGLGILAAIRYDYAQAERAFQEALPLVEAMGLQEHMASFYTNLSVVARYRGHGAQAEAYALKGLVLARKIGHKMGICDLITGLGVLYTQLQDFELARQYLEEAITVAEEIGHPYHKGKALDALIQVSIRQEDWGRAEACLKEMSEFMKSYNNDEFKCSCFNGWGEYYIRQELTKVAAVSFREALDLARKIDEKEAIAKSLYGLARVALKSGDLAQARLYGEESAQIFAVVNVYSAREVERWLEMLVKERKLS
ncbi:MAG: tetratricopeptide repeat protein [Ktedonobacteraceae bacterium]|nr:tetratricopeptide repeat protein [Ktedonobacteraceae bacterium]